jgi:dynein heavy chain, axonemal
MPKRIQNINEYLTYRCWFYSTRGLYEDDRLMFTLLLALRIDLRRGKIHYDEFDILIKGGASLDMNSSVTKPFRWLNDMAWLNLLELSRLKEFHDVIDRVRENDDVHVLWQCSLGVQLQTNERLFKDWFERDATPLPDVYAQLSLFHRFLFVRSITPDRTIVEARHYIEHSLGNRFIEIPVLNLDSLWEESDGQTPLLALLSSGADPTSNIQALAKKKNVDLSVVAMGQGQDILARRLLQQMTSTGGWLLLQNAHLGLDYLDELFQSKDFDTSSMMEIGCAAAFAELNPVEPTFRL